MKRNPLTQLMLAVCVLLALRSERAFAQQQLQGSVWEGSAVHTYTTPLSGVTVSLYGSNNAGSLGTFIASTTTSSTGQYGLNVPRIVYEYYNIVETDPSGYTSVGATTVSGTVVSSNQIQYAYPLTGKTLTGNKFWDDKPSSQTSNTPPVAEAAGPYSCTAGSSIEFDGSGSYDPDTGDSITKYEWDLDYDGVYEISSTTNPKTTKTFSTAGTGTVSHRVTDTHGAQDIDTGNYTVSEQTQSSAGAVYGMKFEDKNGNHQKDAGESGLAGWQIQLLKSGSGTPVTATTGSDGKYSFTDVAPGTYKIEEVATTGWTQTYPPSPGTYTVTVAEGQAINDLDFGNMQSTSTEPPKDLDYGDAPSPYPEVSHELGGPYIGNPPDAESGMQRDPNAEGDDKSGTDDEDGLSFYGGSILRGGLFNFDFSFKASLEQNESVEIGMWIDFNQDGDWNEPDERVFAIHITSFSPTTLNLNDYYKGYPGLVPSTAKLGTTFARIHTCKGPMETFFLTPDGPVGPGEVEDYKVEIGEGLTPVPRGGYFGGAKFNDLNGNGICDFGEPGLPNWTIWLDMNGNGTYDAGVDKTTQTDANGLFNFTGLSDGSYVVGEIPQPGWVQTYPGGAGTNTVNVKSGTISVLYAAFGNHQTTTPGGGTPGGEGALKWYQPPLRHPEKQEKRCYYGWSEKSLEGSISIADDWFCYNARPVTSITWWGAYAGWDNIAPPPDAPPLFHIGVWSNAVIENEQDFGHPKKMIREWYIERSRLGEKADKCNMMPEWMQKPDTSFQYTFSIPKDEQFVQDGDSTVYWLSIAAVYPEPPNDEHVWGWLTRERYFNNDAVRILEPAKARPDSLFRIGETIPMQWDMAFVLGTDQNTGIFDFGDATDELNTTLARNGALHLIRHDVRLGETVDAENDGQPDPQALGDDKNGSADEDGVTFLSDLVPGNMAKAAVSASTIGFLNAWLDINGNGKWDPRERILNNLSLRAGNQKLEFPVADDATPGERIVRFRFSTFPYVWVKGFAPDGEVEDYQVTIQQPSTGVNDRKTGAQPGEFKLFPNYPNPFNPSTTIRFDLPKTVHVRLSVYNLLGQEIAVLDDADRTQGAHEVRWDGFDMHHRSVPAGVYIYRLEAGSYGGTGKLLLLK